MTSSNRLLTNDQKVSSEVASPETNLTNERLGYKGKGGSYDNKASPNNALTLK